MSGNPPHYRGALVDVSFVKRKVADAVEAECEASRPKTPEEAEARAKAYMEQMMGKAQARPAMMSMLGKHAAAMVGAGKAIAKLSRTEQEEADGEWLPVTGPEERAEPRKVRVLVTEEPELEESEEDAPAGRAGSAHRRSGA